MECIGYQILFVIFTKLMMPVKSTLDYFLGQVDKELHIIKSDLSKTMSLPSSSINFLLSGKKLRSNFIFYSSLISSLDDKVKLGVLVELIHSASLIHDDIVDESTLRRGFSTLQHQFFLTKAISTGYRMFSTIFSLSIALSPVWRDKIFLTLHQMCLGEIWEIEEINNKHRNIAQYRQSVMYKTASLFSLCCGLADPNQWNTEYAKFGLNFGFAFQLYDDLLDIYASENELGKTSRKDLSLGILTLPEILNYHYNSNIKAIQKCAGIGLSYLNKAISSSHNEAWIFEAEKLTKRYLELCP
jgi:geranylgeranyl pyrophosphate synthase